MGSLVLMKAWQSQQTMYKARGRVGRILFKGVVVGGCVLNGTFQKGSLLH